MSALAAAMHYTPIEEQKVEGYDSFGYRRRFKADGINVNTLLLVGSKLGSPVI